MKNRDYFGISESHLKGILCDHLSCYFHLQEDVHGVFPADNSSVIIDFLAFPKGSSFRDSFGNITFGIEVKAVPSKEPEKKGLSLAWQSITYAMSSFDRIRPSFVTTYPPLDVFFPEGLHASHHVRSLVQRGNVGSLHIEYDYWKITFGSQLYFHSKRGPGKVRNLGTKRHVGTPK